MIRSKHRFRELDVQMQSAKPQRLRASRIILYLPEDQSDCDLAHARFCFITIEIKQF